MIRPVAYSFYRRHLPDTETTHDQNVHL